MAVTASLWISNSSNNSSSNNLECMLPADGVIGRSMADPPSFSATAGVQDGGSSGVPR
jgi:hypothetical protein